MQPLRPPRTITRRSFLAWAAILAPMPAIVRRAHVASILEIQNDPATLHALADTVLPSALGTAGIANAVRDFTDWGAGYHEGAEVVHGYGTSRLRTLGPTPLTRWTSQLADLDARAQNAHQKRFSALARAQREAIVRTALQEQRLDRMPNVADANHVAVALVAHFYDSPAATDLCYEAQIGKQTCRPLAAQARKPLPMMKLSER